jgi:hypothetical protein
LPDDSVHLSLYVQIPDVDDYAQDTIVLEISSYNDGSVTTDVRFTPTIEFPMEIPYMTTFDTSGTELSWWLLDNTSGDPSGNRFYIMDTTGGVDTSLIGSMPWTIVIYQDSSVADAWLISPLISLEGLSSAHVKFSQMGLYIDRMDYHAVMISTNNGTPSMFGLGDWDELEDLEEPLEGEYSDHTISLEDYLGESVFIAFRYQGFYADYWFVDDFEVNEGAGVGDKPAQVADFKIEGNFPNPFNGATTIIANREGAENIEILDISGKVVSMLPIANGKAVWTGTTTSGADAPCGIYFYRIAGSFDTHRMIYLK